MTTKPELLHREPVTMLRCGCATRGAEVLALCDHGYRLREAVLNGPPSTAPERIDAYRWHLGWGR